MTGLELLKKEMINRGCNKAQCDSKAVLIVLEILANDADGKYVDLAGVESEINKKKSELNKLMSETQLFEERKKHAKQEYELMEKNVYSKKLQKLQETDNYIKRFLEALEQAETPEARDRLRIAQTYINSVNIDSKYDNTAFIIGLSALLSGVQINPLRELKKINPKLMNEYRWEYL